MSETIDISRATFAELSAADFYAIARLRQEVFIVEQECAYPDLDNVDLDPATLHFWAAGGGRILSYLRMFPHEGGWRIGRVCTAKSDRGIGLSARLMREALTVAGPLHIVLDSQTYAMGFYEKHGFVGEGEEFLDDGIPHKRMRRQPEA